MPDRVTLGRAIAAARKAQELSLKELAQLIEREEGGAISFQYLNDIEHDRRTPSSDHLIREFSRVLGIDENYLFYLANRIPAEARKANLSARQVEQWMAALRRIRAKK
jgi:transcriptional regulator with XRE-family HTH domain